MWWKLSLAKGDEAIVVSRCKQTTAALFAVIQALQNCPTLFAAVASDFQNPGELRLEERAKPPTKKASVDISLLLSKAPHFDLVSAAVPGNQPLGRYPLDTKQVAWCCGDRCTKGRTEFHCAPWANGSHGFGISEVKLWLQQVQSLDRITSWLVKWKHKSTKVGHSFA